MFTQPVIESARQIGGPSAVPEIQDGDIFSLPLYKEEFLGGAWEKASGPVALRFPTFGDEVEIERLCLVNGGTTLARAQAAIYTCLASAPASWFRPNPTGGDPLPAPDRLPCSPELIGLYGRWILWRDSFRRKAEEAPGGESEQPAPGAVVGGPGAGVESV